MSVCTLNPIPYTPRAEELLPDFRFRCSQLDCGATFANAGNFDMHLERHHRLPKLARPSTTLYHCPEAACVYHEGQVPSRHFKSLKYLRQHYQKVHSSHANVCGECGKKCATPGRLRSHRETECGRKFRCAECGWEYQTLTALQTHAKRKNHVASTAVPTSKAPQLQVTPKVAIPRLEKKKEPEDPPPPKRVCFSSVQTDPLPQFASSSFQCDLDEIHSLLRDIETQTELSAEEVGTTNNSTGLLDQMLAQSSSHMHTQTCDEFLSELGLADIQTQTNWPSACGEGPEEHKLQFVTAATSTSGAYDELLVSTETQTSFTQCLVNCGSGGQDEVGEAPFGSLYNTQYTQTCDLLLEDLFGPQASPDLMSNYQSTYTQT